MRVAMDLPRSARPQSGTQIRICPICGEEEDCDEAAFSFHVNSHLNDPSDARTSSENHRAQESHRVGSQAEDEFAACPVCDYPFDGLLAKEREQHVNNCIDSQPRSSTPPLPMITRKPTRSFNSMNSQPESSRSSLPSKLLKRNSTTSRSLSSVHTPSRSTISSDVIEDEADDIQISDTAFQQARASGSNIMEEEWDGPALPGGWNDWKGKKVDRGDKWWDPHNGDISNVPDNTAPGLINSLEELLDGSGRSGHSRSAVLGRDIHFNKCVWKFDMGWGCGYRNCLMLISSLILHSPAFRQAFSYDNNGADPGIRRMQGWLDEAWSNGYDPEGAAHFKGKVLGGRKWIGTGDLYALLSYKGVPCDLYDFPKAKRPDDRPAHKALMEWIVQYFNEGAAEQARTPVIEPRPSNAFEVLMRKNGDSTSIVRRSEKFPLILQHAGHSRTVVGYEESSKGEINILIFDPGKATIPSALRESDIRHTFDQRHSIKKPSRVRLKSSTPELKKHASHTSIPFTPPYTNGNSELTDLRDDMSTFSGSRGNAASLRVENRLNGGAVQHQLEEDEYMDSKGWVKKKSEKFKHSSALGRSKSILKGGDAVTKGLSYFRVDADSLSHHTEFQVLVVNGDQLLSTSDKNKRRILSSTIIR